MTVNNGSSIHRLIAVVMCAASMVVLVGGWSQAAPAASWVIQQTPNDGDHTQPNHLYGVSCLTGSLCYAVGAYMGPSDQGDTPVTMTWNGASWSMTSVQVPGGIDPQLLAVSCLGATDCSAVGSYKPNGKPTRTLVEHWNGSDWSIVASPNPTQKAASLAGVSCIPSAGSCIAVGNYATKRGTKTLAERWDGASWTIVATPNPAKTSSSFLSDVACSGGSACTAVGAAGKNPLAERWDGGAWTVQTVAKPNGTSPQFSGVDCPSATSCVAVGLYGTVSTPQLPLVETWNGTAWKLQSAPHPAGNGFTYLAGVDCQTKSDCIAVGGSSLNSPDYRTLAEAWDGSSWTIQDMTDAGFMSSLAAVSGTGSQACTAVGSRGLPAGTLAERYS
jgi:hypothetical protein